MSVASGGVDDTDDVVVWELGPPVAAVRRGAW